MKKDVLGLDTICGQSSPSEEGQLGLWSDDKPWNYTVGQAERRPSVNVTVMKSEGVSGSVGRKSSHFVLIE